MEIGSNSTIDQGQIFDFSSFSTRLEETLHSASLQFSNLLSLVDKYQIDSIHLIV